MTKAKLLRNLSRIVVAADFYTSSDERPNYEPEIDEIIEAFNASELGKFMPLYTYAFDGDKAKAMERFLKDEL